MYKLFRYKRRAQIEQVRIDCWNDAHEALTAGNSLNSRALVQGYYAWRMPVELAELQAQDQICALLPEL